MVGLGWPALMLGAGFCASFSGSAMGQGAGPALHAEIQPGAVAKAEEAYLAGAKLISKQDLAGAQERFAEAVKLNPTRTEYAMALTLTRGHRVSELVEAAAKARMLGDEKRAGDLLAAAKAIDPEDERVQQHVGEVKAVGGSVGDKAVVVLAPPMELSADGGERSIHLRGDAKSVISGTASVFGITVKFDDSMSSIAVGQLKVDLDEVPYNRAMPLIFKMSHTFGVVLDRKTLLVAKDSQENRARLERQLVESIYVPGSTPERLNELTNIVKNVFDVQKVSIAAASGTMEVRAPAATLTALNETLEDLMEGASEVVLEMKLVTVARSRTLNTGTQTPTSLGAFNAYSEAQSIVSANQSLVNTLLSSGGYVPTGNKVTDTILEAVALILSGAVSDNKLTGLLTLIGSTTNPSYLLTGLYTTSGVTFNFGLTSSDTRALEDVTVRVGDGSKTTLRVGERYPITTATYQSGVSSATSSALSGVSINGVSASTLLNQYLGTGSQQTIPQVQYQDLGLTVTAEPHVMRSGLVNMKLSLKVEALAGASSNGIPVLTSSVFESDITVPDGTSAMMLSELTKTQSASISGLPGLSELPGFQESAADDLKTTNESELVLMVTPHVVQHRASLTASRRIPFATTVPVEY